MRRSLGFLIVVMFTILGDVGHESGLAKGATAPSGISVAHEPHCSEGAASVSEASCPANGEPANPTLGTPTVRSQVLPPKSTYNLFHPTPTGRMRPMSTDRPDQTESPYTVDAGHFQLEMDFVNATFDREASLRTENRSIAPVNFKVGLLNNMDIQFVMDTYAYSRVRDRAAGSVAEVSGLGDVATRVKINFWGNDGGRTAFGMLPFVKWPLPASDLRNGRTEGGIIFPLAVELAEGWDLGAETALGLVRNAANDGYDTEFINSVTVGHDLTQTLGVYVELFTLTNSQPGFGLQGQVDVGATYALRENIQLDAGCNFGVTHSAPDFNPFAGLSWRF